MKKVQILSESFFFFFLNSREKRILLQFAVEGVYAQQSNAVYNYNYIWVGMIKFPKEHDNIANITNNINSCCSKMKYK